MTVNKLLTGYDGPLSNAELVEWVAYTAIHNAKEKEEAERAKRSRS